MKLLCSLGFATALVAAVAGGHPARAQSAGELMGLAGLAAEAPDEALVAVDRFLALQAAADPRDNRLIFDLLRLKADLLLGLGRRTEAAEQVQIMARLADANRETLDTDPVVLLNEAADYFAADGDFRSAEEALGRALELQREGAMPPEVIARTFDRLGNLAEAAGRAADASDYRADAADLRDPTKAPTRGGDDVGYRAVDVYYATDRARSGSDRPERFYGGDRGDLELGIATVTIPNDHEPGMLEAPSIWRLEFSYAPSKHVVLQSVTPVDPDGFFGRLQGEFDGPEAREAFVFVHGYNVTFEQAAKRAAQIAFDMNFFGVPILYSWPSRGTTIGYVADTAVVRLSGRRLSRFLEDLVEKSSAPTIHVVAHSMGNRALTDALELLALRKGVAEGDDPLLGQVLFAAPDVDAGLFKEMIPTIRPVAERLTLYASEEDWALVTSRKLHGDAPRAGQGGGDTLTTPTLDSVDMSELGEDMMAHSYFANDSSALADILTLFWQNADPGTRCGLVPDDTGDQPLWRYMQGVCSETYLVELLGHLQTRDVRSMDGVRQVISETVADPTVAKSLESAVSKLKLDAP